MLNGLLDGKLQKFLSSPSTLVLVLVVTLLFGLYPKTNALFNTARVNDGRLEFAAYGLVESDVFLTGDQIEQSRSQELIFDFSITPHAAPDSVTMIALLGSENPAEQLFIAQWRDYLLVMNGGLHQHLESQARFSVRFANPIGSPTSARIISGPMGSQFWLEEELVLESPRQLRLPSAPGAIYFGNTKSGDRSWLGTIHRFSLALGDTLYAMVPIAAENNVPLSIEPIAFFNPLHDDLRKLSDAVSDIVINFLGFIPLGVVLASYPGFAPLKRQVVFAIIPIFFVSFMIEVSQIWMPARYASYIDLVANTLGGAAGILLANLLFRVGRRGGVEKSHHGFD